MDIEGISESICEPLEIASYTAVLSGDHFFGLAMVLWSSGPFDSIMQGSE